MPGTDHWHSLRAPWVELLVLKKGESHEAVISPPDDFAVRVVRGRRCKTKDGLLAEFARALAFPSYFGMNWDAFEECLTDLEWLPAQGYVLVVKDAEQVLPDDEDAFDTLLDILKDTGKAWAGDGAAHPKTPFHAVFTVPAARKSATNRWGIPLLRNK